jgi:hypothetical protein
LRVDERTVGVPSRFFRPPVCFLLLRVAMQCVYPARAMCNSLCNSPSTSSTVIDASPGST